MEKQIKEKVVNVGDSGIIYEISYLLLPSLADSQVPAKVASIKEMLTSAGGAMVSDEDPVLIDLAYPITKVIQTTRQKCNSGYFGWVKFEMSLENVTEGMQNIKKSLDNNPDILRYIIIKTVRENTLLNGKMKFQNEEKDVEVREESGEVVDVPEDLKETSPEDLDKSIDGLVIA